MHSISSTLTLNNGAKMPFLGLGVWQIPDGQPVYEAVTWALEAGYRHIDTAKIYKNEAGVGKAIRESNIPRKDIWLTTKLWSTDQLHAEKAFEESLERLGLEYIDLYLVHWPVPGNVKRAWQQMEKVYESGKCKAVGVSNHSVGQLEAILSIATTPPAVNQVKCSPYDFDEHLYSFCNENGIALEAYSPLTRGEKLGDETLAKIAANYQKSTAQILIRWAIQKGMVVIPKSQNQERIRENANVFDFELAENDMKTLDNLSK